MGAKMHHYQIVKSQYAEALKSTEPESNPHHLARDGGVLPLDHQCLFQNVSSGIGENRTHIARIKSPMHYLVCHNPMCRFSGVSFQLAVVCNSQAGSLRHVSRRGGN